MCARDGGWRVDIEIEAERIYRETDNKQEVSNGGIIIQYMNNNH